MSVSRVVLAAVLALAVGAAVLAVASADPSSGPAPTTPIKHLVVIFDENESFDHYFGTYPNAANPPGEPRFDGHVGNKAIDGLTPDLLQHNPNLSNPKRLARSQAVTCDQKHGYSDEQLAANNGLMDKFVQNTQGACADPGMVMNYYDGNTVTALWNLAQHFALADNSFGSGYGPSSPGAIELVSGNTHGVTAGSGENGSMIGDPQPKYDECSNGFAGPAEFSGQNIGNLMNNAGMTWGWFAGGFKPTSHDGLGRAVCGSAHTNAAGASVGDYIPHHQPFQYYASTSNPRHLPPTGPIGQTDQANHLYDLSDFDRALREGLPDVSFLKAVGAEDAHPGYSGPLDEQRFIVRTLNALQQAPEWSSTAVIIAYDDSDGWYDHVYGGILNPSQSASDGLTGVGQCGAGAPAGGYQARCGPGPRVPLLVISPYAQQNFVYSGMTEQTSVLQFIEDNWSLGRIGDFSFDDRAGSLMPMFNFAAGPVAPKLFLDETTGQPKTDTPPTPTPTPTPTATPTPPKPKPFKLACKATGSGRKVTVKCSATGDGATTVKTSLKLRIERAKKLVVKGSKNLSRGKATITLKPKHKLKRGTYTVRIAVKRAGKTTNLKITFRVKK